MDYPICVVNLEGAITMNQARSCRAAVLLAGCFVAWILAPGPTSAAQKTSENDARLAKWLMQYPQADADGDGVLTLAEAKRYRESLRRHAPDKPHAEEPTLQDVCYGSHPRNVLDFYRAPSETPRPVLIFFHGGGFVGGDKRSMASSDRLPRFLAAGISVVAANYRFIAGPDSEPFPGPMKDGARVIQFVRSKAAEWNLDPARVALIGGSAGACMSMWLAMHDDLADPTSDDPVARQSTRVSCVVAYGGQSSLDPEWILEHIGGNPSIHPSVTPFYGIQSIEELAKPELRAKIREASPITYATKDDPPMYLAYATPLEGTPLPPETPIGTSIHHARFGKLVKDTYDDLGIECVLRYKGHAPEQSGLEFLAEHLGLEKTE
jgi:acetyl esterase/lipase